jgi:hypothetical protein
MHIDTLLAEIETDLSQYKTAGLIDRSSIYRWTKLALKAFGQSVCILQDTVVQVKNGQAKLPDEFHSLEFAVKCSPNGLFYKEEDKAILQNSFIWKERVEDTTCWNSCEPSCKVVGEKTITENIHINDKTLTFYYDSPMPLRLGRNVRKDFLATSCRNIAVKECPYEITIDRTTMHTNFPDGVVFLQFYGVEVDSDKKPIIYDSQKGEVENYIEYHLKRRLVEKMMLNGDNVNLIQDLSYLSQKEQTHLSLAKTDLRALRPESYRKLAYANRRQMMKYEILLPVGL